MFYGQASSTEFLRTRQQFQYAVLEQVIVLHNVKFQVQRTCVLNCDWRPVILGFPAAKQLAGNIQDYLKFKPDSSKIQERCSIMLSSNILHTITIFHCSVF